MGRRVVFLAAGAVAVVDGICLIVGVVTSPRTLELYQRVRLGIRRLIHHPHAEPQEERQGTGEDPGLAAYREALRADLKRRGIRTLADVAL